MISGRSYADVKRCAIQLDIVSSSGPFYTEPKDLRKLLDKYNIVSLPGKMVRKWESLPSIAIVAINYQQKSNTWHWVVFSRHLSDVGFVLDPRKAVISARRTDFGRMLLRSYIEVHA